MNAKYNAEQNDDSRFDRLVDGAMTTAEYKSFLASLEDEPGGWRRCAMAFLEAQAWGKECSAIRRVDEESAPRAKELVELRREKTPSFPSFASLFAAAVSVLLAFGLGMTMQNQFFAPQAVPTRSAGQNPSGDLGAPPRMAADANTEEDLEIAAMKLVIDGAGNQEVVVPVISDGSAGGETLVETEPVIPDSVLRALRMRGHDIRRQQEFIPVPTGDGRHVIFPVEQYQITPVSSRSY